MWVYIFQTNQRDVLQSDQANSHQIWTLYRRLSFGKLFHSRVITVMSEKIVTNQITRLPTYFKNRVILSFLTSQL